MSKISVYICPSRRAAWFRLGQAEIRKRLAALKYYTRLDGSDNARFLPCETCGAKVGKFCNEVKRGTK